MRRRSTEPDTVPLTVRSLTSDGADVRLLLEAEVRSVPTAPALDAERITHALVVPALERWVGRHELASLTVELERSVSGVAVQLDEQLGALGTRLLRLEVVAVEHLLASPSADPAAGRPG